MTNISKRAQDTLALQCPLNTTIMSVLQELQHPEFNPNGALNLGLAHNDLLHEKVFQKCQECLQIVPNDVNYGAPQGSQHLLTLLSAFFNKHFKAYYPVEPEHVFTQTGAGASVNQLIMSVSDKGDYCMVPAPYYGAFDLDISVHTGVHLLPVYIHGRGLDEFDEEELVKVYEHSMTEGKRITSMIVTNPDNPFGRCYSLQELKKLIAFASERNIHIIFDEIYALSSFGHILDSSRPNPFISVLSLEYKTLIEPSLVHVIYGMSKDFAVNGLRVGFTIDQFNAPLRQALSRSSAFSYTSTITDRLFGNLLSDTLWVDQYLEENRQALAASYEKTVEFLENHGFKYIPANAGHFLMIDVRPVIQDDCGAQFTFDNEKEVWRNMVTQGVYVAPGLVFHAREPGFFRLTFALPWKTLEVGLNRILNAVKEYKVSK